MGVSIGRGSDVLRGDPLHRIIHKEATVDHSGEGVLLDCICNVRGGGYNSGYNPDGALVGSRRGKQSGVINEEEVYLIDLTAYEQFLN